MLDIQPIEDFIAPFVSNIVFEHVGLTWIINTNQELNFYFQHPCTSWILNGPLYNTMICSQLHGFYFEDCVTTTRRDIYNIMCSIEDHDREHPIVNY